MTKNEIVNQIADKMGMEQNTVRSIVQKVLDGIIDVIEHEKHIELRNFGVFTVVTRKERPGRNPKTGEEVMVPAHPGVKFKPGRAMIQKTLRSNTPHSA